MVFVIKPSVGIFSQNHFQIFRDNSLEPIHYPLAYSAAVPSNLGCLGAVLPKLWSTCRSRFGITSTPKSLNMWSVWQHQVLRFAHSSIQRPQDANLAPPGMFETLKLMKNRLNLRFLNLNLNGRKHTLLP